MPFLRAICVILGLLATWPASAAEPPADITVQPDRWEGRSEFWRQVGRGFEGRVNQPAGGAVLVQRQGADWGSLHNTLVLTYGKQLMVLSGAALLALGLFTSRGRALAVGVMRRLRWIGRIDRFAYALTAVSFLLLGMTGLIILYGRHAIAPMLGKETYAAVAGASKYIHDRVSWAFMVGVVLLVLVWLRDYLPAPPRRSEQRYRAGLLAPLTPTEKLMFWSVIGGGILVSYSGLALLFPVVFADLQRMQLMQIVHSLSSLTLASLLFGHVLIAAISIRENARKLSEAKEVLEQRVDERTRELMALNIELEHAKNAAEDANRTKDRFMAAASHDLMQPLSAARLMVATLRRRSRNPETRDLVESIHSALGGAEELLSDLLDIARIDARGISPELGVLPAERLLSMVRSEFQPIARRKGLHLRVVPCGLTVQTDGHLLARMLRNLVSNALRYTRSGRVLIGCRRCGGAVRFEVWDSGIGIAADRLEVIFQEFHREGAAAHLHQRGAGLGLAIVQRLGRVLAHAVAVRSVPGRGSVFSVTVPLAAAPSPAVATPSVGSLEGLRVLLVDNDADVLTAMSNTLADWGCHVLPAASAEQALAAGPEVDLLVVDYHLGEQVGIDVVAALRVRLGAVPAVIVTADRSAAVQDAIAAAGLPLLHKPVRLGKLRALMGHMARVAA